MNRRLEELRNIGPKSAAWLRDAGFADEASLRTAGAALAYTVMRGRRGEASLNLLWAIEGALTKTDWRLIPDGRREELLRQFEDSA